MQLPSSTVSSDPSLLSLLFPGAAVAGNVALSNPDAVAPAAGFAELFAGLDPALPAGPAGEGELSGANAGPTGAVWASPVAGAANGLPRVTGYFDPTVAPAAVETDVAVCALPLPVSEEATVTDATVEVPEKPRCSGATKTKEPKEPKKASAETTEETTTGAPAVVCPTPWTVTTEPVKTEKVAANVTDETLPAEPAAEAAFQTPRFCGLPTAAQKHHPWQGLPPGVARHLGMIATRQSAADGTGESDGATGPEGAVPLPSGDETEFAALAPESGLAASGDESGSNSDAALTSDESDATGVSLPASTTDNESTLWSGPIASGRRTLWLEKSRVNAEVPAGLPALPEEVAPAANATDASRFNALFRAPQPHQSAAPKSDVITEIASQLTVSAPRPEPKANFAARTGRPLDTDFSAADGSKKSFVTTEDEILGRDRKTLGIGVAKTVPAMFAPKFTTAPSHPGSDLGAVALASGAVLELPAQAASEPGATEAVSSAHEAVQVVLHTVEHAASREQKSVALKFSVGDADLTVRVELHANEVRTTFRTDSSELRAALAQEWQGVASSSAHADRSVRLAPAVFSAADQSGSNSSSGDGSSRQRQADTPRTEGEHLIAAARVRRPAAGGPAAEPAAVAASAASRTSRRLHVQA